MKRAAGHKRTCFTATNRVRFHISLFHTSCLIPYSMSHYSILHYSIHCVSIFHTVVQAHNVYDQRCRDADRAEEAHNRALSSQNTKQQDIAKVELRGECSWPL